jgi:hypothetical protein
LAGKELRFWDYLKAAFNEKIRTPLLGDMPLNQLALAGFAIFGLVTPGFLLLGVGLEAAYLLYMTSNPRYQKIVQSREMAQVQESWSAKERESLARLDRPSQERYRSLVEQCRTIFQADEAMDMTGLSDLKLEGLGQLLPIFLNLLSLRQRIRETLARTRREDLESDIKDLKEKLAREPENSPVRRGLEGTLQIQEARLANLDRSSENLRVTETELDRIEKQVSLVTEELAVTKNPESLSVTLDGVVKSIQGTSQWMADHSELFSAMDVQSVPVDVIRGSQPGTAQKQ